MRELHSSQYALMRAIGIMGLMLPCILLIVYPKLLNSISHYYYTPAGTFYIGILFCFGLVLICYKGYGRSDDIPTTIAGIFVYVSIIIPTNSATGGYELIDSPQEYLYGHSNSLKGLVHGLSSFAFLFVLGWMSIFRFAKDKSSKARKKNFFYKAAGYIVWISIASILALVFTGKAIKVDFNHYVKGYIYILETIAIWTFSVAWLVKGQSDKVDHEAKLKLVNFDMDNLVNKSIA